MAGDGERVLQEFLDRYLADLGAGAARPLADYQALFPGHEPMIAAEYQALAAAADRGRRTVAGPGEVRDPTLIVDRSGASRDGTAPGGATTSEAGTRSESAAHAISEPSFFQLSGENQAFQGERVGPYRVLSEIGRGGMGVVYRAVDTRLDRPVALKVLGGFGSMPPRHDLLLRFAREAEAASRLDHPAICPIYEVGTDEGRPYIAMRFVDGTPLADKIKEAAATKAESPGTAILDLGSADRTTSASATRSGGTTAAKATLARAGILGAVRFLEKVARALHVAHEAGVIHRDIKPANLMVTREGEPVILDFGIARIEGQHGLTMTQDCIGTPAYMAPEQFHGEDRRIDRRTDVWALGVTLYEMLTLELPWVEVTRDALFTAIVNRPPRDPRTLNPAIGSDLRIVIETALEKDRGRRYQSALDLAEDLRRFREFEPILARPLPRWLRLRRWVRRHPVASLALTAVFLLLAGAWAVTLAFLDQAREHGREVESRRRVAQEALDRFEELADVKKLADLREAAMRSWPPRPESLGGPGGLDAWLADADGLQSRLEGHLRALAELRLGARPEPGRAGSTLTSPGAGHELLAALSTLPVDDRPVALALLAAAASGDDTVWHFASPPDSWRHEVLTAHVGALAGFPAERNHVERLAEFARTVEQRTLRDPEEAWKKVVAEVADPAKHPDYGGLRIRPQLGLLPLGPDPASGLQEFAHLHSGEAPVRDPKSKRLRFGEKTAIVFVLVPPGSSLMGAQQPGLAPGEPGFDPAARPMEGPVHEVELDAFLIAKTELTQAQWTRLGGRPVSSYGPGQADKDGRSTSPSHPVENMSWEEADALLRRVGLRLPTEAQWEYAARAAPLGSGRPWRRWWTGDDPEDLRDAANLADQTLRAGGGRPDFDYAPWEDGFTWTAPAGELRPNAFGLHDTAGNVFEWCADRLAGYQEEPRPGDGLREPRPVEGKAAFQDANHMIRGGAYLSVVGAARSSARDHRPPGARHESIGVRPARALE